MLGGKKMATEEIKKIVAEEVRDQLHKISRNGSSRMDKVSGGVDPRPELLATMRKACDEYFTSAEAEIKNNPY